MSAEQSRLAWKMFGFLDRMPEVSWERCLLQVEVCLSIACLSDVVARVRVSTCMHICRSLGSRALGVVCGSVGGELGKLPLG